MKEKEKMERGLWYDANYDEDLVKQRSENEYRLLKFNQMDPRNREEKLNLLRDILGQIGEDTDILAPFYSDYGKNCKIGSNTFINRSCYMMDGANITVGNNCFIGPFCGMYTANHPLNYEDRNKGYEKALPITIEDNCWIGANVTIMPGVTIREGSVIGAGSLVTKNIEKNSLAYGSPCKVIRKIDEKDRLDPNFFE